MRRARFLRTFLAAAVFAAAGSQALFANCTTTFGGLAIFQCQNKAFFNVIPGFDPNVYAPFVDPNSGANQITNVSAVFWQIGFGNNKVNTGGGSNGTGVVGVQFNGNDSGVRPLDIKDGFAATGDPNIPVGSICLVSNNWGNAGVDGCCDDSRSAALFPFASDGILNPYYDVYYAQQLQTQGYYSLDWQQDYPMAVLLKNVDGSFFAMAAVATLNRGNTGGNGDCSAHTGNPAACDFRAGFYNFRDINNGLPNPTDPNKMNVIPWQPTPSPLLLSDVQVDPNDPNSDHMLHLQWSVPTVYSDGSVRPTTNPAMGGGGCTSALGCASPGANDPTRAPGVGVNDISGKFGGLVHFAFDVADQNDPNFTTILQTIPVTDPNDSLITVPNGQCFRLRTIFGKQAETASVSAANCRIGKCGDIGYEVNSLAACTHPGQVCVPLPAEICNGKDDTCEGKIDEGDPGGGIPCNTGLPGQCQFGITHCVTDPNTNITSDQCIQLTVPDPNLPSPVDPNRNEDPNDAGHVADPNHPTLFPQPEICNGLDDNCDGFVDPNDPGGGFACDTGRMGECAAGLTHCVTDPNSHVTSDQCFQLSVPDPNILFPLPGDPNHHEDPNDIVADPNHATLFPQVETCNGKDDNCNGQTDDLSIGANPTCGIGACENPGTCDPKAIPPLSCTPKQPTSEICNGVDDDCNGVVDDPNPLDPNNQVGIACLTGRPGVCSAGIIQCTGLKFAGVCHQIDQTAPSPEVCNGLDDDCDGQVDNFVPKCGVGGCERVGTCVAGVQTCTPGQPGPTEFCDGIDNNCDGIVDNVDPNVFISPCTLYYTSPLNGDVVDCSDPANIQPTLTVHPAQYDEYQFWISTDPNFKPSASVSSGKPFIKSTSFKVPKRMWTNICKKATDGAPLYFRVQGRDFNVYTTNPLRKFFSPSVLTTVSKP